MGTLFDQQPRKYHSVNLSELESEAKLIHAASYVKFVENMNLAPVSYNGYIRFMKTLFFYFIDKEYIKENPFIKFKLKKKTVKKRVTIPRAIRAKIKEYLYNTDREEYWWLTQLTYQLLMRPKESFMLRIRDIDFENRLIILPGEASKNHNERVLAIPQKMFEFFSRYKNEDCDKYIFSTGYMPGFVLKCARDSGKVWDKIRRDLRLPSEYQFYSLKDTAITELSNAGVSPKAIQGLADHHDLSMTAKYDHKMRAFDLLEHTERYLSE